MPPKWSLGYQQCRWSYDSSEKVLKVLSCKSRFDFLRVHFSDGNASGSNSYYLIMMNQVYS